MSVFTEALAKLGSPRQDKKEKSDIMFGLMEAISALTRCTEDQHKVRTSLDGSAEKVLNRGRIVCITSLKSSGDGQQIIRKFRDALAEENKIAAASDELMPIEECELEIIDLHSLSTLPSCTTVQVQAFDGLLCEIGSYKVGKTLAGKLLAVVQRHFDLAITTITGIPMKEEQNAGSSANYDVGILHSKKAHDEILCLVRMNGSSELSNSSNASLASSTSSSAAAAGAEKVHNVVLKWCQPRLSISDLLHSTAAFRISAIDVTPGGPPSISEGPGGRVTDYRIKDFGAFMKKCRLAPCQEADSEDDVSPIERAKHQLERMTRNYPMTIGETVLYNLRMCIDPLMDIIYKPTLTEDDKRECRDVIYSMVKMKPTAKPLPVPTMTTVRKGNKRDEQYRQMWSELEALIRSSSDLSPDHEEILECVLSCRKPSPGDAARRSERNSVKQEPMEVEPPVKRVAEPSSTESSNAGDMFSPESPPPCKKPNLDFTGTFGKPTGGGQSLLSMWTNRLNNIHARKHDEFAGRAESFGAIASLYPDLKLETKPNPKNSSGSTQVSGKAS
ncbi:hypothetical protein BSL78_15724 [Apostichopus japonicus]|uniref:Protein asunder n=1 Tax=Stichopus japonicus TaxID=307972 RepID=A0A2G8KHE6_STIJA|nr:hypothetical protein BSL78_15724 [Apostichopus japonicus]